MLCDSEIAGKRRRIQDFALSSELFVIASLLISRIKMKMAKIGYFGDPARSHSGEYVFYYFFWIIISCIIFYFIRVQILYDLRHSFFISFRIMFQFIYNFQYYVAS